jgi:hypothetical protein
VPRSGPDRAFDSVDTGQTLLRRGSETYGVVVESSKTGSGKVLVLADDRLFANIAMTLGDNAAFLQRLFEHEGVEDVEIWDDPRGRSGGGGPGAGGGGGGGSDSPMESLAKAHLLPIVLQLLALVILYLLYRGTRFGTPKDPKEESRRAFADHGRALGVTYARANATRHAVSIFSVWALDRLRERLLGSGRRGGLTQLAEAIASRTGRPLGEVMQVLSEAHGLRDEVAPPSSFRPAAAGAYPAGAGADTKTDRARHFWIMGQLDAYLAATSAPKTARRR